MFASYHALASNDLSLIRPLLMYWVVLAGVLSLEYITHPILRFIPFYGFLRLGVLLWLVLPQTQGAIQVYETHVAPWLARHDDEFEQLLCRMNTFLKDSSIGWIVRMYQGQEQPANDQAQKETTAVETLLGGFRSPGSYQNFLPSLSSANRDKLMEAVSEAQQGTLDSLFSILSQIRRSDADKPGETANTASASPEKEGYDVVEPAIAAEAKAEAEASATQQSSARRRWW